MQFYANECNEEETLTPNPNECNSTLTSGASGGTAPTYTIYTREGGQLPNPKSAILRSSNVLHYSSLFFEELSVVIEHHYFHRLAQLYGFSIIKWKTIFWKKISGNARNGSIAAIGFSAAQISRSEIEQGRKNRNC